MEHRQALIMAPVGQPSVAELLAELDAAEAAVAAFGPSPEQLREEAAEAERLAKENGVPPKSAKVIGGLERRWQEFLEVHGEAYEYDEAIGPTIDLAMHFQVRWHARLRGMCVARAGQACRECGGAAAEFERLVRGERA